MGILAIPPRRTLPLGIRYMLLLRGNDELRLSTVEQILDTCSGENNRCLTCGDRGKCENLSDKLIDQIYNDYYGGKRNGIGD